MATFIPADISKPNKEVQPKNGKNFSLAELQSFVGGYIELLDLPDGRIMIINEEGKDEELPRNVRAGELTVFVTLREMKAHIEAQERRGVFVFHNYDFSGDLDRPADYIAGDVLVCKSEEVK